jgi:predicted ATPase
MNITLITGVHEALKYLDCWFELNEFKSPLHPSQIAEKVKNFTCRGAVTIYTQNQDVLNGFRVRLSKDTIDSLVFNHHWKGQVHIIEFDKRGRTTGWTEGFFDQTDNDLDELLGI